jgi:hypothetical protein
VLTWITELVLDRSGDLPRTGSLVVAIMVWAVVVSLVASAVASVARSALYGASHRLEDRYRRVFERERGVVHNAEAVRLANRAVLETRVLDRIVSVLDFFGGHLVFWPHSINPLQVFRIGALGAGVSLALSSWPAAHRWQPGDVWDRWAGALPDWDDVKLALPIAVVVLGVLVVSSRTPLLDRIRARDEAAKDANRVLAKWSFAAAELASAAIRRAEDVHRMSGRVVRERCCQLLADVSYSMGSIVDARDEHDGRLRHTASVPLGRDLSDTAVLVAAMARVETLNEEIRTAGLRFVAWNLIPSVTPFIHRAGADWLVSDPDLRHSWYLDDVGLDRMVTGRLAKWHAEDYERGRADGGARATQALADLAERAVGLEVQLSVSAVDLLFRAGCLRVAHDRISKRLLGSPWTKVLSVAKS